MKSGINAPEGDLMLEEFLDFLAKDLASSPERSQVINAELRSRAQSLVEGINIDLDSALAGDVE